METNKSSKEFDDRMSSVLAAMDTAISRPKGLRIEEGGLSPHSDASDEERPRRNDRRPRHRSRSPGDPPRHRECESRGAKRGEWARPRGDYQLDRDRGSRGHRRFDGRRGRREKKILPAPDYLVNPSGWTKYDLTEDGTEGLRRSGMSDDQVNKYAAFQFLTELRDRKRRERGEGGEEEDSGDGKVLFRTPKKRGEKYVSLPDGEAEKTASGEDGKFGTGGVLKMPEYVVGGSRVGAVRGQRRRGQQITEKGDDDEMVGISRVKKSCISLSHLEEEDED